MPNGANESARSNRRDYRRVLFGALQLAGSAVGSRVLAFIAFLVVARTLGPEEFGRLTALQTMVAIGAAIAGLGLQATGSKIIAALHTLDTGETGRVAGSLILMTAGGASVVGIGTLVLGNDLAVSFHLPSSPTLIIAAAALVAAIAVGGVQTSILYGLEAFRAAALVNLGRGMLTLALLAIVARHGFVAVLLALLAIETAASMGAFFAVRQVSLVLKVQLSFRLTPSDLRLIWDLGLPALVGTAAVLPALLFGQWLLSTQPNGLHDLGVFGLAYRFHLGILLVPSAVAPMVVPLLARAESGGGKPLGHLVGLNGVLTVGTASILALFVIYISGPLGLLFGKPYVELRQLLAILAVGAIFSSLNNVLSQAAIALGMIRTWVLSDVVLGASVAGVAMLAVPSYHAAGLAVALLSGMVATCVYLGPLVWRNFKLQRVL